MNTAHDMILFSRTELSKWEQKMLRMGNINLISRKTIIAENSKEKSSSKSAQEVWCPDSVTQEDSKSHSPDRLSIGADKVLPNVPSDNAQGQDGQQKSLNVQLADISHDFTTESRGTGEKMTPSAANESILHKHDPKIEEKPKTIEDKTKASKESVFKYLKKLFVK